ncbi:MAG: hypothetical protein OEZ54_04170 [Gemmatimonadota bacterium]|nr:hypothetical protein [Gemmatimonadota bacterium]
MRFGIPALLLAWALGANACSTTTKRPSFAPLSGSFVDTLTGTATAVLQEIEQALLGEGLEIKVKSEADRYLETRWYRTDEERSADPSAAHPERTVRFRVWVDEIGPAGTRAMIELAHRRSSDPSLDSRQAEVVVPTDHVGHEILTRIIEHLWEHFSG